MSRGRTVKTMTTRFREGQSIRRPDELLVEEPLEIRLDDHLVTTTMRTPGNDFELAVGFCHGEGLLGDSSIDSVRYCGTGSAVSTEFNVVSVSTKGSAPIPAARIGPTNSSCGMCGSAAIESLLDRLEPLAPARRLDEFDASLLGHVEEEVRTRQELFQATGASHGAAIFDVVTGAVDIVREDIGRHNAVDKVVGRLLLDGVLPVSSSALWVSGRASFEMVQKAWAAGFPMLVSVSGASALAVEVASSAGLALIGFSRDAGFTSYSDIRNGVSFTFEQ